jgi:hypothetical protein
VTSKLRIGDSGLAIFFSTFNLISSHTTVTIKTTTTPTTTTTTTTTTTATIDIITAAVCSAIIDLSLSLEVCSFF